MKNTINILTMHNDTHTVMTTVVHNWCPSHSTFLHLLTLVIGLTQTLMTLPMSTKICTVIRMKVAFQAEMKKELATLRQHLFIYFTGNCRRVHSKGFASSLSAPDIAAESILKNDQYDVHKYTSQDTVLRITKQVWLPIWRQRYYHYHGSTELAVLGIPTFILWQFRSSFVIAFGEVLYLRFLIISDTISQIQSLQCWSSLREMILMLSHLHLHRDLLVRLRTKTRRTKLLYKWLYSVLKAICHTLSHLTMSMTCLLPMFCWQ